MIHLNRYVTTRHFGELVPLPPEELPPEDPVPLLLLPLFGVLPGIVLLLGDALLLPGEVALPGVAVPEVPDPVVDLLLRRGVLPFGDVELPGAAVPPGVGVASGGFCAAGEGVAPGDVLGGIVLSRVFPGCMASG